MPWRFRSHILCWWGLEWICPESLYDLLVDDKEIQECGKASYREKKRKKKESGKAARKLVFWPIFGPSRNEKIFRGKGFDTSEVDDSIKAKVAVWITGIWSIIYEGIFFWMNLKEV